MELGGHAPVIVREDVDIKLVVKSAGAAKFRAAGQACISPTRFLVHERVADDSAAALGEHAAALKLGDGADGATRPRPLAGSRRVTAITDLLKDARNNGTDVVAGVCRVRNAGNLGTLTVLANAPLDAKIFDKDRFGSVAAGRRFSDSSGAIAETNRLPFRLVGYAFTRSLKNADLLSRKVEVGMPTINMLSDLVVALPRIRSCEPVGAAVDSACRIE